MAKMPRLPGAPKRPQWSTEHAIARSALARAAALLDRGKYDDAHDELERAKRNLIIAAKKEGAA
jgi:hypothetical protein